MVSRNTCSGLPPGFRFHPTDEELIMHYLRNQATSQPCPVSIIPPIDIYKFDPWELPDKADFGEKEWYFFSPRDRKYPNGVRPNRAAVSGYWKATGTDKAIHSGSKHVGIKKALVFYKGKPPKGVKTDWIMHEYRLTQSTSQPYKQNGSMRLDDWVLCRIYKKKNLGRVVTCDDDQKRVIDQDQSLLANQIVGTSDYYHQASESQPFKFPRACSLTHLWEFGGYMNENSGFSNQDINYGSLSWTGERHHQLGQVMHQQPCTDDVKFQVNQQPMFELQ